MSSVGKDSGGDDVEEVGVRAEEVVMKMVVVSAKRRGWRGGCSGSGGAKWQFAVEWLIK